jgi:hypothetical protein
MIDIALHVEDRRTTGFGNFIYILIPILPVTLTDCNAVEITPENFTDLFGSITVGDLRGLAVNEGGMTSKLRHAASNDPRVRVDVKKNNMANTLSRSNACGSFKARLRFKSQATSNTVSTSSFVKSRSPIKSRPLKFVCIF